MPTDMEYLRFDASGCGFPKPRVPVLPTLGRHSLGRQTASQFSQLGVSANAQFFTRGRYALTEAYRLCGLGPAGGLMAPSYHCRTMLDPALSLGAEIVLYSLKPDLSPDLQGLKASLSSCKTPVKALLVTHYFGFAQALEPLAAFCDEHHITLIEDCSHALFVRANENSRAEPRAMGRTGRFGIASPYKFFPAEDGGLLWGNDGAALQSLNQRSQSLAGNLKGVKRALQAAINPKPTLDLDAVNPEVLALTSKPGAPGAHLHEQNLRPSHFYLAKEESLQGLACSRWVMRHTDIDRLANQRRQNYQQWLAAVAALPHCRALFPDLPNDCVPYMFPLRIDHPETHFYALKYMGMPVWRWDDMAVSPCGVATGYREQVLHLPCHQELTANQMAWMTRVVAQVMQQPPMQGRL